MTRALFAMAAALTMLTPRTGDAFVQTLTCDESGQYECRPGEVAKPVRWSVRCVNYYINESLTSDISDDSRTMAAIQQSFTTWSEIPGGEFAMEYAGLTDEDRAEHIGDRGPRGNANVVVWRDRDWPYPSTTFAVTSVTFDPATGIIADADIELNSEVHRFTTGDENVIVDVSNTLTHEVGHFLGLDHEKSLPEVTMFDRAPEGELDKRTLEADDIAGYMAAYPAVGIVPECEDVPEFFAKPDRDDKKGCCATTAPSTSSGGFALLLGALLLLRRRRD